MTPCSAKVLLSADDGTALLTVNDYGKGKIFYLSTAPELTVLDEKTPQWYHIYKLIAKEASLACPEDKAPEISRTEHILEDGNVVVIELNYSDRKINDIPANGIKVILPEKEMVFP